MSSVWFDCTGPSLYFVSLIFIFFVCSVAKDEEVAGLKVIKVKKNPGLSTILLSHSCSALMLLPCS